MESLRSLTRLSSFNARPAFYLPALHGAWSFLPVMANPGVMWCASVPVVCLTVMASHVTDMVCVRGRDEKSRNCVMVDCITALCGVRPGTHTAFRFTRQSRPIILDRSRGVCILKSKKLCGYTHRGMGSVFCDFDRNFRVNIDFHEKIPLPPCVCTRMSHFT